MTTKYITVTDTAKLIRAELKEKFPDTKFSVRSESYAGGASIRVTWFDGPAAETVEAVTNFYQGKGPTGLDDYAPHISHELNGETVSFGSHHVIATRQISDRAAQLIRAELEASLGMVLEHGRSYETPELVYRAFPHFRYGQGDLAEFIRAISEGRARRQAAADNQVTEPAKAVTAQTLTTGDSDQEGGGVLPDLVITHTREEGTLISGTARGDGTAEILKANRWRWSRNLGSWYIPQSRDRAMKRTQVTETFGALTEAGFNVALDFDDNYRPTADVEADRAAQASARAAALEAKVDRKASEADQARQRADAAHYALPEGGEPIKVGHHSETRHRKAIDKAHRAMGQLVEADQAAEQAAYRAEVAAAATDRRNKPVTAANRIKMLTADKARCERELNGHTRTLSIQHSSGKPIVEQFYPATGNYAESLRADIAELTDKITYWEAVRAEQFATGRALDFTKITVEPGDYVFFSGSWSKVLKVNKTSVTIEWFVGTFLAPYGQIKAFRSAEQALALNKAQ